MNTQEQRAVRTNNITKCFGSAEAISNCTIEVEEGTIYGFLGENGAGKTTMLKLLTGLLTPEAGGIEIFGKDLQENREAVLADIGSLIEAPAFYEHLSAQKNLRLHMAYMGASGMGTEEALKMVGLSDVGDKPASAFSMGMRQRLGIARAIIHRPRLLILDEPVNGLDALGIREMRELFKRLAKESGITILLSGHILSEIEQIADRVGFISKGKIVAECEMEQIRNGDCVNLESYYFTLINGGIERMNGGAGQW